MKIVKYTWLFFAIGISSCTNELKPKPSIEGIWCDQLYHCVYFDEKKCIIDKAEINKYTVSNGKVDIVRKTGDSLVYNFTKDKDTLKIRRKEEIRFRNYVKTDELEAVELSKIYYSQVSDFNDFNCSINQDGSFLLDIKFHQSIKEGKYSGFLEDELMNLISILINQMNCKLSDELDSKIISDTQEWGLIIHTKSEDEFKLYHNYKGINKNHMHFATMMNYFPLFLDLNPEKFSDDLLKVQQFRENEFKRNLKENDL